MALVKGLPTTAVHAAHPCADWAYAVILTAGLKATAFTSLRSDDASKLTENVIALAHFPLKTNLGVMITYKAVEPFVLPVLDVAANETV